VIFNYFKAVIPKLKASNLGGLETHFKLAPSLRLQYDEDKIQANNPRKAAVLVLFYPNKKNETCFLLTKRASYKGTHSAQISFPGGKIEQADTGLAQTALRETFEEVGIVPASIKIIREITDVYIPPSNFLATPFLGFSEEQPTFSLNHEVANTIEVLVSDLLDEKSISSIIIDNSYMVNTNVPCFKFDDSLVWGATAMMLSEIKELLKQVFS
jgi:8-oxo-dGTP pyrophosphatase MutT (NUDIX family)